MLYLFHVYTNKNWSTPKHYKNQDYFNHFEQSQSLGGEKMGDPREKTPDHPQAELGLSQVIWARLNPQQWDDEQFRALKISRLNHLAYKWKCMNSFTILKIENKSCITQIPFHMA